MGQLPPSGRSSSARDRRLRLVRNLPTLPTAGRIGLEAAKPASLGRTKGGDVRVREVEA